MKVIFNSNELFDKLEAMLDEDFNEIQLGIEDDYSDEAKIIGIDIEGKESDFGFIEIIDSDI